MSPPFKAMSKRVCYKMRVLSQNSKSKRFKNGGHLGFDPYMTLKRSNNSFSEFNSVENEALHTNIRFLFQKLENNQIHIGPTAAILNFASHKFSAACARGHPTRLFS